MDSELRKIAMEALKDPIVGQHQCQYCKQKFVRESTLAAHQCEPKRRHQQKTEKGVMIGYQAWIRFYELTQGSAKTKTYDDFAKSQFYTAFVKFGRHCHGINAINVDRFIEHVIKNNLKIDHWCKDKVYEEYLLTLLKTEAAEDALARGVKIMDEWADEFKQPLSEYFRQVSDGRFVHHVKNGRISAWLIYNCESGQAKLEKLSPESLNMVWQFIDPDFWARKLKDYPADAEMSKQVLAAAGL